MLFRTSRLAAAGCLFSFASLAAQELWVWGENDYGQLGDGTTSDQVGPVKIADDVTAVSAGSDHSLYLTSDGTVMGMGLNDSGQLGDGTTENRSTPVAVSLPAAAVEIAAGGTHSLFLLGNGDLYGVGSNLYGQIAAGSELEESTSPVLIDSDVVAIAAGIFHSLYLKEDGSLWGIGSNHYGELGMGSTTVAPDPVEIASNVAEVVVGAGGLYSGGWYPAPFSVYRTTDGTVYGMGATYTAQLGLLPGGETDGLVRTPREIATGVAEISGGSHLATQHEDGAVWVRGRNADGEDRYSGSTAFYNGFSPDPQRIATLPATDTLIAGAYHTFVLSDQGTLTAYQANGVRQEGLAAPASVASNVEAFSPSPAGWSAGFTFTQLKTGHFLMLTQPGTFSPWPVPTVNPADSSLVVIPPRDVTVEMNLANAQGAAVLHWFRGTLADPYSLLVLHQDRDLEISPFGGQLEFFLRAITPQGVFYGEAPVASVDHGYEAWADAYGLAGDDRLASADPDGDQIDNATEHQVLLDPTLADDYEATLGFTGDDAWMELWVRADGSGAPAAEVSANLEQWATVDTTAEQTDQSSTLRARYRFIWERADGAPPDAAFFRLP